MKIITNIKSIFYQIIESYLDCICILRFKDVYRTHNTTIRKDLKICKISKVEYSLWYLVDETNFYSNSISSVAFIET